LSRVVTTAQLTLPLQKEESMEEKRYRKLLLGMDLTQDFFFSYTYDIASTLQNNLTASAQQDRFDSMFVWNDHLTRCAPGMW
jgi:phosphatidylinositol 3,5-bisphosphate 5-phosphatase